MKNKNNTPEQKAAWIANHKLSSRLVRFIAPDVYAPQLKEPSRRDLHRAEVASRRPAPAAREAQLPGEDTTPAFCLQGRTLKRTVYQLASAARRIPHLRRRLMQALTKKRPAGDGLTDKQVASLRARVGGCAVASGMLQDDLRERNIGGKPFRDARTPRIRVMEAALKQSPVVNFQVVQEQFAAALRACDLAE
jgi:hypothetical protein